MSVSEIDLQKSIDSKWARETRVVLRYRNAFTFGATEGEDFRFKALLGETSIKEWARILPLLSYKGVEIHLQDETSLMRTKTLKSIDGCVSIAKCPTVAGIAQAVVHKKAEGINQADVLRILHELTGS